MNDKNNGNSVDLKANLEKIASTKPRKRTRKDNIYERFITRVGSTEEDDHTESKSDKSRLGEETPSPTYEPLSAEELQFFASLENDKESNTEASNTTSTNISFDFTNEEEYSNLERDSNNVEHTDEVTGLTATDDEVATLVHSEDKSFENMVEATKESEKQQGRLASNKKPLIIGIILGTLLAAIVVLILNASGILSPAAENTVSDNSQGMANGVEEKSNSNVQSNSSPVVKAESAAANNTNQNSASQKNVAANGDNNTPSNVNGDTTKPEDATDNGLDSEPDITYEDFREESKNTLYRETDD